MVLAECRRLAIVAMGGLLGAILHLWLGKQRTPTNITTQPHKHTNGERVRKRILALATLSGQNNELARVKHLNRRTQEKQSHILLERTTVSKKRRKNEKVPNTENKYIPCRWGSQRPPCREACAWHNRWPPLLGKQTDRHGCRVRSCPRATA